MGCGPSTRRRAAASTTWGQFEEYALYQENQSFLPSRQVITFTDLDGRLLALKPDVTLSIAKSAQPAPGETKRFYYSENVYRPAAESHTFKEIAQMGVEFIGRAGGGRDGPGGGAGSPLAGMAVPRAWARPGGWKSGTWVICPA